MPRQACPACASAAGTGESSAAESKGRLAKTFSDSPRLRLSFYFCLLPFDFSKCSLTSEHECSSLCYALQYTGYDKTQTKGGKTMMSEEI
jgi:hypothetical protein